MRQNRLLIQMAVTITVAFATFTPPAVSEQSVQLSPPQKMLAAIHKPPAARPSAVRTVEGVVYRNFQDGKKVLKLDICLPSHQGKGHPTVICIGGGYYQKSNRVLLRSFIQLLAQRGFAGIAVDYRTANQDPWPAALHDCKAAVRWARAHAHEYSLDPNQIATVGWSAGGNFSALLALTGGVARLEGDCPNAKFASTVHAAVSLAGPSDLAALYNENIFARPILESFLKATPTTNPAAYQDASPVFWVGENRPPIFLLNFSQDVLVPSSQATTLAEKLKSAGSDCSIKIFPGVGHGLGSGAGGTVGKKAEEEVLRFLKQKLQKKRASSETPNPKPRKTTLNDVATAVNDPVRHTRQLHQIQDQLQRPQSRVLRVFPHAGER